MQKTTLTLLCKFFYVFSFDNFLKKSFFFNLHIFNSLGMFLENQPLFFKSRFTIRVDNAMASNQKATPIKTLRKWEKDF